MKTKLGLTTAFAVLVSVTNMNAAQVDLGITLGSITGVSNAIISDASVELGIFSGYSEASGSAFFTGKDWTTLRAGFTPLTEMNTPPTTNASSGQFYGNYDLATTASGTRLFAWIHSSSTPLSSANWAVITGGANPSGTNSGVFNPMWLAVASTDVTVNIIEAATTYSQIMASSGGASIVSSSAFDPEGANIALVPEPSTGALMMVGAAGLVALRRLRKV